MLGSLRVAVFSRATHRHSTGGMATAAWNIARALADQRHDVVLFTTRTATFTGPYPESGVLCFYLDGTEPCAYEGGYYDAASRAFWRESAAKPFDAIVSISKAAKNVLGHPQAPPMLFTSHGIGLDRFQDEINIALGNGKKPSAPAMMSALDATYSARVPDIGCTEQEFYLKWTALGGVSLSACMDLQVRMGHHAVFHIQNPVYDVDWNADPPGVGREVRSPMKVLLCAGNLGAANKGIATVMTGLRGTANIEVHLVGANGAQFRAQLPRSVDHGHVPHIKALELIGDADVLVDPSLHHSGLNMAVTQALSLGVPVIAYPLGGMTSAVRGGTGVLVKPGDSMALVGALERVRVERSTMSHHARAFAQAHFHPLKAGERYTSALHAMIAGQGCGPRGWL